MENVKEKRPYNPEFVCGARLRQGTGRCRRPAGWGTHHPGVGVCKLHGGAAPQTYTKHSRLSFTKLDSTFSKRYHELLNDPDYLQLKDEIAIGRALAETLGDDEKELLNALLSNIGRLVERQFRMEQERARNVPLNVVERLLFELGKATTEVVPIEQQDALLKRFEAVARRLLAPWLVTGQPTHDLPAPSFED